MNDLPVPGPWSEDDDDIDKSPSGIAWSNELDWANLGQFTPLIESLRAGKPIAAEDWEVREFLADFLTNPRRPSGKKRPPEYSDWTLGMLDGEIATIKKGYSVICNAAAHVWLHRKAGLTTDQALDKTFSEFRWFEYVRDGDDLKEGPRRRLTKSEKSRLERFVKGSAKDRKRLAGVPTRK
jgi:hypothetical protein